MRTLLSTFKYLGKLTTFLLLSLTLLSLPACEKPSEQSLQEPSEQSTTQSREQAPKQSPKQQPEASSESTTAETVPEEAGFKLIEWTDLMPKEDLDALLNPPSYVTDIEDGSLEDQITSKLKNTHAIKDDAYQRALTSTRIVKKYDGKAIQIPGFIVPLEFNDELTITQFFLVPFFGACIHVPPPPPNQIIFVNYPKGFKLEVLYEPLLISGVLKTSIIENDMATAAYSMQMQSFEAYIE